MNSPTSLHFNRRKSSLIGNSSLSIAESELAKETAGFDVEKSSFENKNNTDRSTKPESARSSVIRRLCFDEQSTGIRINNHIEVAEKDSEQRSDYSYKEEDEDGDDEEEYNDMSCRVGSKAATFNKKFACKLRLYDTPHTPKTLMKKSNLDLETTSEKSSLEIMNDVNNNLITSPMPSEMADNELMKSPKHSPMRRSKHSMFSQQTHDFDDSVEVSRGQNSTKTPRKPGFQFLSRFDGDNSQVINKALHFDDSDTENSGEISANKEASNDDGISFKKQSANLSSLTLNMGKLNMSVMKTPAMAERAIQASINPFTPPNVKRETSSCHGVNLVRVAAANCSSTFCKQTVSETTNSIEQEPIITDPESARMPIRKCLVSRYHQEFHEVCKLGAGEFGDVFKCINRLDGCTYAIKRSKQAIAGSALEIAAWKEVCAHAVLVRHNHIVQYYSAWAEQDRMLIQSEYCNGGSLAEFLEMLKFNNMQVSSILSSSSSSSGALLSPSPPSPSSYSTSSSSSSYPVMMNESDLKTLLLHVAKGLSYMHSLHLAHLDIKPGNIFICRTPRRHQYQQTQTPATNSDGSSFILNEESGIESDDLDESFEIQSMISSSVGVGIGESKSIFPDLITYKIGDLGHVTSTLHENPYIEEGDCRYLPNELLQENFSWLVKADIFALALTIYSAGSLDELPKNGDEWHWIRKGNLKDLPQCTEKFKKLLIQMIHADPAQRPSASTLVHHSCICPDSKKSKAQLRKELNHERFKNEMLQRKVKKYEQMIHKLSSPLNSMSILESSRRTSPQQQSRLTRSFSSSP